MKIIWTLNTIKFKIIENFIYLLWYIKKSQEGSHVKYVLNWKILIIPKHKEIARWTLNNIFKILSFHLWKDKDFIQEQFLNYIKKKK